jgi:hypothetical protein
MKTYNSKFSIQIPLAMPRKFQKVTLLLLAMLGLALQLRAQPSVYYATPTTPTGQNSGFGHLALKGLPATLTGTRNTAVGCSSLVSNTSGTSNTGIGFVALQNNTSGTYNTAVGDYSQLSNLTGSQNVAIGGAALQYNTTGYYNVAIGLMALRYCPASEQQVAVGYQGLYNTTTGVFNHGVGFQALYTNTSGGRNSGNGYKTLYSNTSGSNNTADGYSSLFSNSTGSCNTGLGYYSNVSSGALSNGTAIGCNAIVNASNKIRFGDAAVTVVEGPVNYTISDGRFKSNISATDVKGLEFIQKLRPVVYNFDAQKFDAFLTKNMPDSVKAMRAKADFAPATAIRQSGFIAQEVEQAAKAVGYDFNGVHVPENDNDNYSLAYSEFTVPLVKAVQEQQQMIEELRKELAELRSAMKPNADAMGMQIQTTPMEANGLQIVPNPSGGRFTVKIAQISEGTLTVNDQLGHRVFETQLVQGQSNYQIDLATFSRGYYVVSVVSKGGTIASQKLILE